MYFFIHFPQVIAPSDARVPVEMVFDQPCGALHTIRVMGNTCGNPELGIRNAVEKGIKMMMDGAPTYPYYCGGENIFLVAWT